MAGEHHRLMCALPSDHSRTAPVSCGVLDRSQPMPGFFHPAAPRHASTHARSRASGIPS